MKYFSSYAVENLATGEDMEKLKSKEAHVEEKHQTLPNLVIESSILENDGGEVGRPVL